MKAMCQFSISQLVQTMKAIGRLRARGQYDVGLGYGGHFLRSHGLVSVQARTNRVNELMLSICSLLSLRLLSVYSCSQ